MHECHTIGDQKVPQQSSIKHKQGPSPISEGKRQKDSSNEQKFSCCFNESKFKNVPCIYSR
jgi:hypothetical protein